MISINQYSKIKMDFKTKEELTIKLLTQHYPKININIESIDTEIQDNYRNKTIYSINQKNQNRNKTFRLIDKKHIEIIKFIENQKKSNFIKDIFIKSNFRSQIQLCFTIIEDNLGSDKIQDFLNKIFGSINPESLYYRIYNSSTKSKFDSKEIEQKSFYNSNRKLKEKYLNTTLFLSPYTFSRINYPISTKIYKIVDKHSDLIPQRNVIFYGRDVYYLHKSFTLSKPHRNILTITHCKITYQDIKSDPDLGKINYKIHHNFKNLILTKKEDYTENLNSNPISKIPSQIILTAGRNGLPKSLTTYFITNSNIKYIIYIACNRETMSRDLGILKPKFTLEKAYITDEFPQTEYNNTILFLKKKIILS